MLVLANFVVVEHIVVDSAAVAAASIDSQIVAALELAGRQADVETAPENGPARQSAETVVATACFDTCFGPFD